jgi:hypothetical protein
MAKQKTQTARVVRVQENIIKIEVENQEIMKNEVAFVHLMEYD